MKQKPTYEEMERRVKELEKRVQQLEAQPREQHFHYHPPIYHEPYIPYVSPAAPPPPTPYKVVIGDPISIPSPFQGPWDTSTVTWPNPGGTIC